MPAATNTTTLGGGGADSQLPSPPQDLSQATHGGAQQQQAGGAGGGALGLSKEQVLQRKLECLEQPQLLVTSIPCPQASVLFVVWGRGATLGRCELSAAVAKDQASQRAVWWCPRACCLRPPERAWPAPITAQRKGGPSQPTRASYPFEAPCRRLWT